MNVRVDSTHAELQDEVLSHVEARIRRALGRWPLHVAEAHAVLEQERRFGALHTTCRLELDAPTGGSITTSGCGRDAEEALLDALR